jgi:hypothetical protein
MQGVFSEALIGESIMCCAGLLLYFLLKMADYVVSAVIVLFPTVSKGTSGSGWLRVSAI